MQVIITVESTVQKISTVESLQMKRMTGLKNVRENSQTFDGKNCF